VGRVSDGRACDHEVARIAAGQRGLITRAQLLEAGVGTGGIAHRVRVGRLHRVVRGVYVVGHPSLPPGARELAALLAVGPDAVLSHRSAAAMWGLLRVPAWPVEVTVLGNRARTRRGLSVHRTTTLNTDDRRVKDGLPVTAPLRTLLDLAEVVETRELEQAVAEAQTKRLVTHERLLAYIAGKAGRRGAAPLRALLRREGGPAFTRSEAERLALALIRSAQLPPPSVNARAAGYEVDFLWPEPRVVVELDGYVFHSSRRAFERDHRKTNDLESADYAVRRFTWRQITEQPHAVVAVIAVALA
jgi:very-short-patch-repair endonuclease